LLDLLQRDGATGLFANYLYHLDGQAVTIISLDVCLY